MKKKYILFAVLVMIVVGLLIFYFTVKKGKTERTGEMFTVKRGNVTYFTEQTGMVKAQVGAIVKVGTRATGTLTHLKYQVGDTVTQGELIARIDDREILANIRNTEAQIEQARRDVEVKKAQLDYNKVGYEREERLLEKEYTTKDNVDKARREFDVAVAQLELGKAKVTEVVEKLKALQVSLSYTKIYAPISGYVSQVTTQEGETIVSGLSAGILITIINPRKLEMWIYVDETDVGRVKSGMTVEYGVDAYRNKRFKGKIALVYPQPEIRDNIVYYLAIVKIEPEDTLFLRPEMTTRVRIIIEEKTNVIVVPNGAVRFEEGRNVVYLKEDKTGKGKEVTPGTRDDKFTEIVSGLAEGEQILLPVTKKLLPGAKK